MPVSKELRVGLERLGEKYAGFRERVEETGAALSQAEVDWERQDLAAGALRLWRRVRGEIGRHYVVGFLGSDMERPAWSPDELDRDPDDSEVLFP